MTDREVMQQALEALELEATRTPIPETAAAMAALRARLSEPEPEPVALDWLHKWANQDDGEPETQWHEGYEAARRVVQIHLTAPPQRPAEPEPEPVAWMYTGIKQDGTEHGPHLVWKPAYMDAMSADKGAKATPLYTAPPTRRPLTDEEIDKATAQERDALLDHVYYEYGTTAGGVLRHVRRLARAIERAHKIGGNDE